MKSNETGGQTCTDEVNIQQNGFSIGLGRNGFAIFPRLNFTCNGRITNVRARVDIVNTRNGFPSFQVWRLSLSGPVMFNRIGEVQLQSDDQVTTGSNGFLEANISLTGDDRVEFQSGDVVGYCHPSDVRYSVKDIPTDGYVLYRFVGSPPPTSVNLSEVDALLDLHQPLIQLTVDIRCDNLSTPSNGEITSCSSGRVGVGYEGDTCNFTCNTGYELTGSDTRTCQSDGSWSGSDDVCRRVRCPPLNDPNNGMVRCALGDDGVSSYLDFCRYTCNTGYELTHTLAGRTCQADGSWSGFADSCIIMECLSSSLPMNSMLAESCSNTYQSMCDLQCEEGFNGSGDPSYVCDVLSDGASVMWMASGGGWSCERVQCTTLPSPSNGGISCNSTGVPRYEDQCSFSCDPGYELTGSSTRQCLSNGSWSGADVTCDILHCNNLTDVMDNSVLVNDCSSQFGSVCSLGCITGYMVVGNNMFTCDIVNDGVEWRNNVTGGAFQCYIVTCENLVAPSNGSNSCSSDNQPLQYQDTCTFQCDDGYEVEGSVMRQCEASGEWRGTSTQCNILHCPVTVVANSRPCDDTSYTSTCMVECEDGYNRSGDSSQYSCGLNGTRVTWMFTGSGVTCSPVSCVSLSDPENGNVTCSSNTSVFQGTCTYYCNRGYQLEGNRQTRCSADGTWSSEPVTCTILTCNDPEVEITNSQSVGDCSSVTYGSRCLLNCSSGYSVSGNGEHVCDDVNDEGTSVKWKSVGGDFGCITAGESASSSASNIGLIIGGVVLGILLLIIVLVLIVVIIVHHKKKSSVIANGKEVTSFTTNTDTLTGGEVVINPNPAYDFTDQSNRNTTKVYDDLEYEVMVDHNPSDGAAPEIKKKKGDYDYVVSTEEMIKTDTNPSYVPISVGDNVLDDNPSYQAL